MRFEVSTAVKMSMFFWVHMMLQPTRPTSMIMIMVMATTAISDPMIIQKIRSSGLWKQNIMHGTYQQ
jgi:hypothetical protein